MKSDNNHVRPTIREVAAVSGTSIKTVSRVLNGVTTVDPVLVQKVNKAIKQLNYRPNVTAGNLRRVDGRTNTIGLLLKDIANPFSSALHRAIENLAREEGLDVLAGSLDEQPDRERELISTLITRRVDGLIIVPTSSDHAYLQKERSAGMPIVFIDRPPNNFIADTVVVTNRLSAEQATRHLINHGHTRIAYLGDDQKIFTASERFLGYKSALHEAKLKLDLSLVHHGREGFDDVDHFIKAIFNSKNTPTAIFASQNFVTITAIRALKSHGLEKKIALVGFDELPFADLLDPGISLVTQDISTMANIASRLLFARMHGKKTKAEFHEIPTMFTARGSGEIKN